MVILNPYWHQRIVVSWHILLPWLDTEINSHNKKTDQDEQQVEYPTCYSFYKNILEGLLWLALDYLVHPQHEKYMKRSVEQVEEDEVELFTVAVASFEAVDKDAYSLADHPVCKYSAAPKTAEQGGR
eukprot:TRINITY_DN88413_c1_g1_i1.p3 TRINITY_DN88413_c1_g1~~TRINITY_DN88413_c1_g1_i1.p3  ORF type:complete len:127 (+),score=5.59 TRINITY_DN88413_c1_g1_i1:228-608(+)